MGATNCYILETRNGNFKRAYSSYKKILNHLYVKYGGEALGHHYSIAGETIFKPVRTDLLNKQKNPRAERRLELYKESDPLVPEVVIEKYLLL